MFPRVSTILLPVFLLGAAVLALPSPQLEERAACNADLLLRLLRGGGNLPEALILCNDFLGRNPSTIVTVSTVTPTVTVTTTVKSTSTDLFTDSATITLTGSFSVTDTITETVTSTERPQAAVGKRAKTPLSVQVLSNTYPASRISSACKCLTLPPGTTVTSYVTATAPQVTSVSTIRSIVETSFTITNTVTSSTSETFSVTSTVTSTATVIAGPSRPFKLQIAIAGNIDNSFARIIVDVPNGGVIMYPGGAQASSPTFQIQSDGQLYITDLGSAFVPGPSGDYSWNRPLPWTSHYIRYDANLGRGPLRAISTTANAFQLQSRQILNWVLDPSGFIFISTPDVTLRRVIVCSFNGQNSLYVSTELRSECAGPISLAAVFI